MIFKTVQFGGMMHNPILASWFDSKLWFIYTRGLQRVATGRSAPPSG